MVSAGLRFSDRTLAGDLQKITGTTVAPLMEINGYHNLLWRLTENGPRKDMGCRYFILFNRGNRGH
ncbi:MAG: hypothetical protein MZV63_62860 [Marinilabiliales bacterium]|nr:hypothetical protein [Marinilabiliales bacterium]